MKTIGLLGGMSWESTQTYYRNINVGVKEKLGGLHSAKIAMVSIDFAEIEQFQHQGDWDACADILVNAAKNIKAAGADGLVICTNTMHKLAPQIEANVDIPLIHIADATAQVLTSVGVRTLGLLGTAFTMEQDFYKGRLVERYDLNVITPDSKQRGIVHDVIYNELCKGQVKGASKQQYLEIIDDLAAQGAEAVVLGCTEIGLLVNQADTKVHLCDTTEIHAQKAVEFALGV